MVIRKSSIFVLIILLFPIVTFVSIKYPVVPMIGYYDELVGVISLCYVMLLFFKRQLSKRHEGIVCILLIITVIGLISNIDSGMQPNVKAVVVDVLLFWKTFATYLAFYYKFSRMHDGEYSLKKLSAFSKGVLLFVFTTAIITQFIDIGASITGNRLFGIFTGYDFFWNNGIQTGWLVFCAMLFVSAVEMRKKEYSFYLLIAIISLFLTGSSLVYCWIVLALFCTLFIRDGKTLKIRYLFMVGAVIIALVWTDFQQYFNPETTSVRLTLIQYGIKTANKYFPFGSGFATYGSEMAKQFYSKLYIEFGWRSSWAFGPNGDFLNDVFMGEIIGQFGWFGIGLYLLILYHVFQDSNNTELRQTCRHISVSTIITIVAVMIASASAKSMMGVCTFACLGIVNAIGLDTDGYCEKEEIDLYE